MAVIEAQQTASDPLRSVWVAANAGSGKTKVLTDRVLRLLLRGTPPSRILCITYTKAAAAEMENRIRDTLREWVGLDEDELCRKLATLTGDTVDEDLQKQARQLFATVLDAPEGVRIQTIHGFCQSLLKRFPLEAGIHPHMEVIDERTSQELLREARHRLFSLARDKGDGHLHRAMAMLTGRLDEGTFQSLLTKLVSDRRHLLASIEGFGGLDALIEALYTRFGASRNGTQEALFEEIFTYGQDEESALRSVCKLLLNGSKTDFQNGEILAHWLERPHAARYDMWEDYKSVWLTQKNEPKKELATAGIKKANPNAEDILRAEQERMGRFWGQLCALNNVQYSEAVTLIVSELIEIYNELKRDHKALDYDDLILHSLVLLQKPGIAPWVLFKLDGGLDHLLIDEAQDTSPEQWQLVEKLVEEFFSGESARVKDDVLRTLFVVGDDKQSIFRFQGAAPRAFGQKRQEFARRIREAGLAYAEVPMVLSFRSTQAVLSAVDAVFAQENVRHGVSYDASTIEHSVFRNGHAGLVELWPLTLGEASEQSDAWQVTHEIHEKTGAAQLLANRMATTISGWLQRGEVLESKGRAITAGDLLVLVRSRGAFVHHLVRALKQHQVPVSGVDRMNLLDNIAVMDLKALAEFLLLPEDDLNLACVLKSPICNLGEDALMQLATTRKRGQSLWAQLQQVCAQKNADKTMQAAHDLLVDLLSKTDYIRPFELYAHVLETCGARKRFAQRLGDQVFDPIDEFLSLALDFEASHTPSLQGFLHWMQDGELTVKRDMEQGLDAVRIMTVHGAKGLQAPVVFMPDTTKAAKSDSAPFWDKSGPAPLMCFSPAVTEDDALTAQLREQMKDEEAEEYRRLLYVAMTRAEDRLYICGWSDKDKYNESGKCWYDWIKTGLQPQMEEVEGEGVLRMRCEQTAPVAAPKDEWQPHTTNTMSATLLQPPAPEPFPPQPLAPSRTEEEPFIASTAEDATPPPLSPIADAMRFRRGNLMHSLLQWLPDTPAEKREDAAQRYLMRFANEISQSERQQMVADVLGVMNHPEMAPVFAAGSLSEVPVTGLLAGKHLLSGQIDRLLVREDGVWVIDYKTQRQPPETLGEVPRAYIRQMAIYRDALMAVYPKRRVHAALLWTTGPRLMLLPESSLAEALDSL